MHALDELLIMDSNNDANQQLSLRRIINVHFLNTGFMYRSNTFLYFMLVFLFFSIVSKLGSLTNKLNIRQTLTFKFVDNLTNDTSKIAHSLVFLPPLHLIPGRQAPLNDRDNFWLVARVCALHHLRKIYVT
jgi:hypothetical protein